MAAAEPGAFNDGKKMPWTMAEDGVLQRHVWLNGRQNWGLISLSLPGRSPNSCRLRWCKVLAPELSGRPFTPEEDACVVEQQRVHGNNWAAIERCLPGRTDIDVKNRWDSTLSKRVAAGVETDPRCLELFPLRAGGLMEGAVAAAAGALAVREEAASVGNDEVTGLTLTLGLPGQGELDLALSLGPV